MFDFDRSDPEACRVAAEKFQAEWVRTDPSSPNWFNLTAAMIEAGSIYQRAWCKLKGIGYDEFLSHQPQSQTCS